MDSYYIVTNASRGITYIKKNKKVAEELKEILENQNPQITFYIGCCDSTGYVYWEKPIFPQGE
jgi:hypothetical protein